jgi:hypothetical protein
MEIFTPPPTVSNTAVKIMVAVISLAVGTVWAYSNSPLSDKFLASILIVGLAVLYLVVSCKFQILVDDRAIIKKQPLKTTQINWNEVDDVLILPNATIVKSSKAAKAISIFHPSPENIFHQFRAVDGHDRLRNLILSHSIPFLKRVWNEERERRAYAYPRASLSSFLIPLSPLLIPVTAVAVFETEPLVNFGAAYFYLFAPFLPLTAYLAYRFGLFTRRNLLVLNDYCISLNGNDIVVPWEKVLAVTENPGVLGAGSIIVIGGEKGRSIVVPKSIDRFCDLTLQIRSRVGEKCTVQLNIPDNADLKKKRGAGELV